MKLKAPAKLNLYLEVLGKRDDGYHDLKSEIVFLDLADDLQIEAANDLIIEGSNFTDDIIYKTANLMSLEFGISQGAKIKIQKNIPVGGGLGGGSADAAAAIILLKDFWNIDCEDKKLYDLALKLGADVPACLYHQLTGKNSVIFSGIGEILQETEPKQNMHLLLAHPNIPLSTKDVFDKFGFAKQTRTKNQSFAKNCNKINA